MTGLPFGPSLLTIAKKRSNTPTTANKPTVELNAAAAGEQNLVVHFDLRFAFRVEAAAQKSICSVNLVACKPA